jgi:hypothetical protein
VEAFHHGRILVFLAVSIEFTGSAQVVLEPKYLVSARRAFDTDVSNSGQTQCPVRPIRPAVDFSFRFQTGYVMDLPLAQFHGSQRGVVLLRVTAETGQPVYLVSPVSFPDVPAAKPVGQIRGAFSVGEGKYTVDAIVSDDHNRSCRSHWSVQARLDANERSLHLALAPEAIAALLSGPQPAPVTPSQPGIGRLSILMHIDPPSTQMSRLPPLEAMKLLGSLTALLQELRAQSVRLVVINLAQQKVLLRKDGFTALELERVGRLLNDERSATVDYSTLRRSKSTMDLLAQLTSEELREAHSTDVLIFLGERLQTSRAIPGGMLKRSSNGPRIFYLKCEAPPSFVNAVRNSPTGISAESSNVPTTVTDALEADAVDSDEHLLTMDRLDDLPGDDETYSLPDQRDSIERLVGRMKGETIAIRRPADCARAVQCITSRTAH